MIEPSNHPAPALVGGRYRLLGEVGRGGMATVHRAHDEVLDRPVAIKALHPHLAHDPTFLDRFRREARAAAGLTHANVVTVHDWGQTPDGAYLVLQLVEGGSLRDLLREHGQLTLDETQTVLGAVAAGLGAAHAAGLVHRDVKPENVLIGWDGVVRITDFGLARAAASATSTFGPDILMGSPHYLSPEAVRGEALDPRADVYALGVVLFECLTGRPPHEGDSPYATALAHTVRPVPVPSTLRPDIPTTLDALVLRATTIDRDGRPVDATAFSAQLRAAMDGTGWARIVLSGSQQQRPEEHVIAAGDAPDEQDDRLGDWTAILNEPTGDPGQAPTLALGRRTRGRAWLALLVVALLVGGSALGGYLLWDRVLAPITPIPAIVGTTADQAAQQLEAAGFTVAVVDERPHDRRTPAGYVLDQDPSGEARRGTTIDVVLSGGPRQLEVGDVVGLTATTAVQALRAMGLTPHLEETHHADVPAGEVLTVDPPAGAVVDEASEVTVLVSLGPAQVTVPDLVGERVDDALRQLLDLDLEVEVERRGGFRALLRPNRVYDQAPAPESIVDTGDRLLLYAYE